MQRFRVQIHFEDSFSACKKALKRFARETPAVTRLEFHIGAWPAEIGLEVESFGSLHRILDTIRDIDGGVISIVGVAFFRKVVSRPMREWMGVGS